MNGRGGRRDGAGRKPLGGEGGKKRYSLRVVEGEESFKLSLLPQQVEWLGKVGEGNRSEGFRRVMRTVVALMATIPERDPAEITQEEGEWIDFARNLLTELAPHGQTRSGEAVQ